MRHQRATIEQAMFCCQSSQSDKVKGDSSSTTLSGKKERCTCYQMTTRKSSERERERKRVCRYLRACVKRQRERGSKCVYLKWEREPGFQRHSPPPRPVRSSLFCFNEFECQVPFPTKHPDSNFPREKQMSGPDIDWIQFWKWNCCFPKFWSFRDSNCGFIASDATVNCATLIGYK